MFSDGFDTDEPEAKQIIQRRHVEYMNQILQMVVTEGTGKKAALDFTYTAGKTGTSSSYRDAWFVGFSGALVTGVWIGNDDYRPMASVTGGSVPAIAWHAFMSVAHQSMNIPQIPGLPVHPTQVAERQRLDEIKRQQPQVSQQDPGANARRPGSLMPAKSREALKLVAKSLRSAAGIPEEVPPAPALAPAAAPQAHPAAPAGPAAGPSKQGPGSSPAAPAAPGPGRPRRAADGGAGAGAASGADRAARNAALGTTAGNPAQ